MSVSPLPLHMGCLGVSSDAVNMARGYQRHSYTDRLATVKSSMLASASAEPAPVLSSNNATRPPGNGSRPAAQASPARQAPQVKLQPLGSDLAQQMLGGGLNCSSGQPPASGTPSSLLYRCHTKHVKTVAPTLQSLDFISIAVNSVGGGGVPRPYGKFQACRSGDGNATWERLPPPAGSWQARALPIAVTLLGDSPPPAGPPKADSPRSAPLRRQRSRESIHRRTSVRPDAHDSPSASAASSPRRPLHGSAPQQPAVTSDGAGHVSRVSADATRLRLGFMPSDAFGNYSHDPDDNCYGNGRSRSQTNTGGASARDTARGGGGGGGGGGREAPKPGGVAGGGLHEQSYYRRPGSSLHRSLVPLPPPEPHNLGAWFALPAATFLADVPNVPEQLRMDNGYSVSRDFLMSGLNPPRRPPPPGSPPRSPPQSQLRSHQQQPPPPQLPPQPSGPYAASLPQPLLQLTGDGSQQPPPPSSSSPAAGYPYPNHPPQPLELRPEESLALWNALEEANAAAATSQQQQHQHGVAGAGSPGKLRGVYVPLERRLQEPAAAAAESLSAPPLSVGLLGSPSGGAALRGALLLPPEVTLPRRAEPAGR